MDSDYEFLFEQDEVVIGRDGEETNRTGETAIRNVPGLTFVGPVVIESDECSSYTSDEDVECFEATYRMRLPDGRTFTEYGVFGVTEDGRWATFIFGRLSVPA